MKEHHFQVLTPIAACHLFGRDEATVRVAARKGHVKTPATLHLTGKAVRLIDYESAVAYWGEPSIVSREGYDALQARLDEMRRYGFPIRDPRRPSTVYHVLAIMPVIETAPLISESDWQDYDKAVGEAAQQAAQRQAEGDTE